MRDRLMRGAAQMGIALDTAVLDRFRIYTDLLLETNKVMNLTTVTEPDEVCDRHYLDSLAALPLGLLGGGDRVIDVGTGAGFPGLPLLFACPTLHLTLLDSLQKRLTFLQKVLDETGLNMQATLCHGRAEDIARDPKYREKYDIATARAVANTATLAELTLPFVKIGGKLVAWKGAEGASEITPAARKLLGGGELAVLPYSIPERDWQHTLLTIQKAAHTPAKYPRKAGTPAKEPLA